MVSFTVTDPFFSVYTSLPDVTEPGFFLGISYHTKMKNEQQRRSEAPDGGTYWKYERCIRTFIRLSYIVLGCEIDYEIEHSIDKYWYRKNEKQYWVQEKR